MRLFMAFTALTAALSFTSCASVAYTDRKQINFISPQQEDQQGAQAFDEVKSKSKLSTDPAQLQLTLYPALLQLDRARDL